MLERAATLAMLSLPFSVLAVAAHAQRSPWPGGITLREALDATLLHSVQLQLGERQVQIGSGALLAARAPFDAQVTTALATQRENSVSPSAAGVLTPVLTRTVRVPAWTTPSLSAVRICTRSCWMPSPAEIACEPVSIAPSSAPIRPEP